MYVLKFKVVEKIYLILEIFVFQDIESEVNSEDVSAEKSDNEEFDDETSGSDFGSDGDSDDDWGKEDTPEENVLYYEKWKIRFSLTSTIFF